MSRVINEPVLVYMNHGVVPISFIWQHRHYKVVEVLSWWRDPAAWWDGEPVKLLVRLIAARGTTSGVYELGRYDKDWFLQKVLD